MSVRGDSSVPTPSGMPAIVLACALGVPSAFAFGFAGMFGAGVNGTHSVLTLANWSIIGACFGASAGALFALLCGFHLRRGFCYLFGAAFGAIASMIFSGVFDSTRHDPHQLLKDAVALGFIFLGGLGGEAMRRFVTRFGAKSRVCSTEVPARPSIAATVLGLSTLLLGGGFGALGGQLIFAGTSCFALTEPEQQLVFSVASLPMGILALLAGVGVLLRKQWGRILAFTLAVLTILLGLIWVGSGGQDPPDMAPGAAQVLYGILAFVVLIQKRGEFSRPRI